MFIVVVGLIYYFVPNAQVRLRDVWFGAILAGLLWRLAFAGFSWYVRDLSRFSVHGSVAAVVVFLCGSTSPAVILLYGVEVTAAYARAICRRAPAASAGAAPHADMKPGKRIRSCLHGPIALARERSPYLLQHAQQSGRLVSVGREAFARRAREDKPIFLSIGYSTCHWCHVMAARVVRGRDVAAVLNEQFVPSRSIARSGPTSIAST